MFLHPSSIFSIHVYFFSCIPIILFDSLPSTIEIWIHTSSSAILCQSRHLLKYSSVEKALTNRGLRRSLTASIFLHRGQLPSPRGKFRRTRTKSNLEDQKLKHITLHVAPTLKGFVKERNATSH
ncbi:hypothetical protein SLEP1_g60038 [Rubroshorea leprosula]|uniref:Uncharacterized protein n=1 Tax=Rubroshorea leprosula TaxID=152421 RepID=A0AAV5MY84_9ROSI|nr:hypothetical protein SLEP1_g60038 [Rubroshorea leprosula]